MNSTVVQVSQQTRQLHYMTLVFANAIASIQDGFSSISVMRQEVLPPWCPLGVGQLPPRKKGKNIYGKESTNL